MATTPPRITIGSAEPADAVRKLQQRDLLAPSFRWQDVWQHEHAAGFAVAGVAQADVLRLFSDQVNQSLASGGSLKDFSDALLPQLQAKGWWGDVELTDPRTGETRIGRFDDARLRLIYDVNLRQSYAAGRWARTERTARSKPLVMYRTMRDERVRHSHAAWDGLVLPIEHPFWRTHYPPNGWRCRCRAIAVSERDVQRLVDDGLPIKRKAPPVETIDFVNRQTGEVMQVPVGIDPGFAYNPGQVRVRHVADLQRTALDSAEPPVAKALVQDAIARSNFARFIAEPLPDELQPVALLTREAAGGLGAKGRTVMLGADGLQAGLAAADYQVVQAVVDAGRRFPDGAGATVWVLLRDGLVSIVRITTDPQGLPLASVRRITAAAAAGDAELQRLGWSA